MIDVLGAIETTGGAAAVIAVISLALGGTRARRLSIAVVLGLWFAVLVGLAAAGLFERLVPAGLAATIGSFLIFGGGLRLSPELRVRLAAMPLSTLVAIHVVRFLGLNFLLLYGADRLPAPFGPFAGWGDVAMAGSAVPVAFLALRTTEISRRVVLFWNTVGLLELIAAFTLGITSAPGPLQVYDVEPRTALLRTVPWFMIPG